MAIDDIDLNVNTSFHIGLSREEFDQDYPSGHPEARNTDCRACGAKIVYSLSDFEQHKANTKTIFHHENFVFLCVECHRAILEKSMREDKNKTIHVTPALNRLLAFLFGGKTIHPKGQN
jgi:hypothetical protein